MARRMQSRRRLRGQAAPGAAACRGRPNFLSASFDSEPVSDLEHRGQGSLTAQYGLA